ncbi:5-formyltetrahydrofolate cyclo-ligase [Alphaproteobacteria bacterium]|nr:5-formyltetrahydrofolate cyclo-ligase [Alphaproteobacteria bacterium]
MKKNSREIIRNIILKKRSFNLGSRQKINSLTQNILDIDCLALPSRLAGYWPIRGEIDIKILLKTLETKLFKLCLPCVYKKDSPLIFRNWSYYHPLVPGKLKTWEPWPDQKIVRPTILLVPLVAFDSYGNRLGYGGGYYDRTIKYLRSSGELIAIGLGYEFQRVSFIPVSMYDQRLDFVVTEKRVERFF